MESDLVTQLLTLLDTWAAAAAAAISFEPLSEGENEDL